MLRFSKTSHRSLTKQRLRGLATASSQAEILSKYPIGLNVHGFAIENVQPVPEFSLVAVKLKHTKTGSQHLHLDNPSDKNNVFSVAFKTNPPDSTGVPHILEHTTLCGSFQYPVRDPFFKMLNRSLSNFMNAMTGHDYTYYPFATTNRKDFDNLMSVYLSSVLEPILSYEDFMQEGWRLEQSDLEDKNSPIEYKGVVYNEMKGQCSNTNYLYWIKFQESIYPALKNSGGDPAAIRTLEYEDLLDFHNSNYHPSNAKTFTYGSFPLMEHLQKLSQAYDKFGNRPNRNTVKKNIFEQKTNEKYFDVEVAGPVDEMTPKPIEEQFKSSVTWYLGDALSEENRHDIFKWRILNTLLLDGHNAPFYQDLIESGYSEDFSANCGFDQTTSLMSFTVGLSNLSKEKVDELQQKVTQIITEKVIPELEKGENSSFHGRVQAVLSQLELSLKKHKPDFGLGLLHSLVPTWINEADPFKSLQVETILNRFKADYEEKGLGIFKELIEKSLLNPSTPVFKFTMTPDAEYNTKLLAEEQKSLQNAIENFTDEDKDVIYERSKKLLQKQQEEEDISVLPTVTLADVPRQGDSHALSFSDLPAGGKIQKRVTSTNSLVYVKAAKDLSFLPQKFYEYMPLFNSCLTNLAGTEKYPMTELETRIQQLTGGINFSFTARTDPFNIGKPNLRFLMSGMALKEKSEHIYDLWQEILTQTKFTGDDAVVDKLYTLIKNLGQNQANMIAERGHSYASSNNASQLTPTKYISNMVGGIGQVRFVLDINKKLEEGGKDYLRNELLPTLQQIQKYLVGGYTEGNTSGFNYSIVGESDSVSQNEKLVETFDNNMKSNDSGFQSELAKFYSEFSPTKMSKTILNMPFQVGYASLGQLGSPYASKDGAALQVLSQMLTYKHLHSVIREANGAYGGGLNYDGLGGTLSFYSYRDPNAIKSAAAFEKSYDAARRNLADSKWEAKALQEAKLAIFQSEDAPSHISSEGASHFMDGITDEMRQERRERFLDITIQDLQDVNEKYLAHGENKAFTVLGNVKELEHDNSWTVEELQT